MRLTLLTVAGIAAGLVIPRFDETSEPPLQIELQIDGTKYQLVDGKKVELTIGEARHQVVATVGGRRHFSAAGIEFDYPAHIGFEFSEDTGSRMWTLDGNDVTVIVFEFEAGDAELVGREVLNSSLAGFDAKKKPTKGTIELGGQTSVAWQADVEVVRSAMRISTFAVDAKDRCIVVMLQDMLEDDGKLGLESVLLRKLLAKTFRSEN